MSDTQWPRFEVFVQPRPDRPHEHAGSVHAPDRELALLNARDVFVRRPECVSLWLAPTAAIHSRTAQELAQSRARSNAAPDPGETPSPRGRLQVFAKLDQKGTLVDVGEIPAVDDARDPWEAASGLCVPPPLVVWIIPREAITRSEAEQAESLFSPAADKPFRDQAYYRIHTALRRLRQESSR